MEWEMLCRLSMMMGFLFAGFLFLLLGGLIVLINPWWNETLKLFDVIGAMLLFSALVGIVRLIIIWPIKDEEED